MLESVSDIVQNPIALTIFGIIGILVVLLLIAIVSPPLRAFLVRRKILEENEHPASFLLWIVTIVVIVKLVQVFLVQPFIVDGGSMLPTFHDKEFLLVDKLSYKLGKPSRGDVAIFRLYESGGNSYAGKYLIKRVIGLPGERIVISGGTTTIYNGGNPDGVRLAEEYVSHADVRKNVDLVLAEDEYFVMGDNRAQSFDSRDWGPLQGDRMRGRVLFRLYPIDKLGYAPGGFHYEN